MPSTIIDLKQEIKLDRVYETAIQINEEQHLYLSENHTFELIDQQKFIGLVEGNPDLVEKIGDPRRAWDALFGHYHEREIDAPNPQAQFLTAASVEQILQYWTKFKHGIDFQHLPKGFHLATNPKTERCEVLHFSQGLKAMQQAEAMPLSMTLAPIEDDPTLIPQVFMGKKGMLYLWLRSKINPFCNLKELNEAFKYFSKLIEEDMRLTFEALDLKKLFEIEGELNPILLLARWETFMSNPALKQDDRLDQWQALPHLPLGLSHGVIRALTDYACEEEACGFMIPQMKLTENDYTKEHGYRFVRDFKSLGGCLIDFEDHEKNLQNGKPDDDVRVLQNKIFLHSRDGQLYFTVKESPRIFREVLIPSTMPLYSSIFAKVSKDCHHLKRGESKTPLSEAEEDAVYELAYTHSPNYRRMNTKEEDFWRYIAYQPQRNSIQFYKKAIDVIHQMYFHPKFEHHRWNMYKALAASTTQKAHQAVGCEAEEKELKVWKEICDYLGNFEKNMPGWMKSMGVLSGQLIEGKASADFIHGTCSVSVYSSLDFLHELLIHDLDAIYHISVQDLSNPTAKIKRLGDNKTKFLKLLEVHANAYYQGARFYRHQGTWAPLTIEQYTAIQYDLHVLDLNLAHGLMPHLSTFQIKTTKEIEEIRQSLKIVNGESIHRLAIDYFMKVWQDVVSNDHLSSATLISLLSEIQTSDRFADQNPFELAVLDLLQHGFSERFPPGYFIAKREAIENRQYALTEAERKQIQQYRFKPDEICLIEAIDVSLNKSNHAEKQNFTLLHERLSQLRYILSPSDFKVFLERLASLSLHFPENAEPVLQLINLLITKKSISGFIQFTQCFNEMPRDKHLFHKCVFFVQDVKSRMMGHSPDEMMVLNTIDFEEVIALILIKISLEESQQDLFQTQILAMIPMLNDIAKAHPITKTILLEILKKFIESASNLDEIHQFVCSLRQMSQILFSSSEIPSMLPTHSGPIQDEAKENMLTFYNLLVHYEDNPNGLIVLFDKLKPLDKVTQFTQIQWDELNSPTPQLKPNTVYLKLIADHSMECRLSDEHGELHPLVFIEDADSTFSKQVFQELSERAAFSKEEEKALFKVIDKEDPALMPQPSGMFALFSKIKRPQLVVLPQRYPDQKISFPCLYLSYNETKQTLDYQWAESDENLGEKKSISYINLREQIPATDLTTIVTRLNRQLCVLKPLETSLLTYFNEQAVKHRMPTQRRYILTLINRLQGNHKSLDGLDELLTLLQKDRRIFRTLVSLLTSPPYPDIPTIKQWIEERQLAKRYHEFSHAPYGERALEYTFQKDDYLRQRDQFEGVDPGVFTDELAINVHQQLFENRQKSIHQLQEELNILKTSKPENMAKLRIQLLCLCIEMLARTTGQKHLDDPDRIISQEINTTQLMILYSMLESGATKVISQIATGEGKSRIAMILAACQALMGKTVDVITSDFELSERDYLVYTPFFNSLGIKTSLISLNTPDALYQKKGINFSDDRQLFLLRNQSDILGRPYSYLEQNQSHRCLILDEEDVFRHDKSADLYNYATPSQKLRSYTWIYPHLVEFMQLQLLDAQAKQQNQLMVDELMTPFKDYILTKESDERYRSLDALDPRQIATWLYSAFTALRMIENQDYVCSEAQKNKLFKVVDAQGKLCLTRKVLVVDRGQLIEDSTFAEGLHQALCALKNKSVKYGFAILPENAVQRSSLTWNFINQYQDGQFFGLSGSTRSEAARADIGINYEDYKYLVAPPEKALRREDKRIWLAKDEAQQIRWLKQVIVEKLKRDDPILLICKDDNQSHRLYEGLIADEEIASLLKHHQRIHALTSRPDAEQAIARAGNEGCLTVSTVGRCARGKDIFAKTDHPLLVLAAYVPTYGEEIQIKGRTARCGKPGAYRMIPNLEDSDCLMQGNSYDTEYEVQKIQNERAIHTALQEEVSKLYAESLESMTQFFLTEYVELKNKPEKNQQDELNLKALLDEWSVYLGSLSQGWKKCKTVLLEKLSEKKHDEFIGVFQNFVNEFAMMIPTAQTKRVIDLELFNFRDKAEKIYVAAMREMAFFQTKKQGLLIQSYYEPADAGKARIYTELFTQTRALLRGERSFFADFDAWKEGRGALFPNWTATLHGDRPFFANTRASLAHVKSKEVLTVVALAVLTPLIDFIQVALTLLLYVVTQIQRACLPDNTREELTVAMP